MSSGTVALRVVAVSIGIGLLVFAYQLHAQGESSSALAVIVVDGILIIGGTIFERGRYRPELDKSDGAWTETGEKFQDPTTGKLMKVMFNSKTGERDYREI